MKAFPGVAFKDKAHQPREFAVVINVINLRTKQHFCVGFDNPTYAKAYWNRYQHSKLVQAISYTGSVFL